MSEKGKGHGTIITGGAAQGDCYAYIHNNGDSEYYEAGIAENVRNNSGSGINPGDVVLLSFDPATQEISVDSLGEKATGDVSPDGGTFEVTEPGHTDLSGTIIVSSEYGENGGWGGATGVYCSNVSGEASYLTD